MIDPGTALELVKTGAGTLSQYIVSDPVTAIANLCTISGFSLRNVKGLLNFNKWGEKFKVKFPNGLETEEQETILSDCFIELEDYIKNNSNFDDNVFEKIGALLIHGLENEDLLTREYIRILKQLTWVELDIFLKVETVKFSDSFYGTDTSKDRDMLINRNIKYEYPIEILLNTFDHLVKMRLIISQGRKTNEGYFYGYTDLGINILKLVIG